MKVSKKDYRTMKRMLTLFIKSPIRYKNTMYIFEDFCEYYVDEILYIECVLSSGELKSILISITEMFKICYPKVVLY